MMIPFADLPMTNPAHTLEYERRQEINSAMVKQTNEDVQYKIIPYLSWSWPHYVHVSWSKVMICYGLPHDVPSIGHTIYKFEEIAFLAEGI